MRSIILLPLLLVPATIHAQAAGDTHDHTSMSMQPASASSILLTGPMGSRAVNGTATIAGQTVTIALHGDRAGTNRSWQIRRGSCAQSDGVLGASSTYAPVPIDASGNGSASVTLTSPLPVNEPVHVAVLESSSAASATVACGYLVKGQMKPAMDHSKMNMGGGAMAGMDHSKMDMSGGAMAGMDHSKMDMDGDDTSTLRTIHERMMADPVIRERVASDPVLQKLIKDLPAASAKTKARKSPATKTGTGKKAIPQKVVKPVPAPMSGMDHSKMPGMRKPPK